MSNNRNRKKIIIGLIVAIAAIVAFAVVLQRVERQLAQEEDISDTGDWGDSEPEEHFLTIGDTQYVYSDDADHYLIIGTDAGDGRKQKGFDGEMADFLVLLSINHTTDTYAFMQIDRDTMADIRVLDPNGEVAGTYPEQLCTAHWYGQDAKQRNDNTVAAVSDLFGGLPIKGYYTINMKDIGAVNHAIGGVVIDFDTDMTDIDPAFEKDASVLLSDEQAERFIRARMNAGNGTNIERMSRQRQYMQKAYNLVTSQIRENPEYIDELYTELDGKIESDLPGSEVSRIANQIRLGKSKGILTFKGESKEADTIKDGVNHAEFVIDTDSIVANLQKVISLEEV